MGRTEFVDEPFSVTIKAGNAILEWPNGDRRAKPLSVFRIEVERGLKALLDFDASHKVVRIGKH